MYRAIDRDTIPAALEHREQWVAWREEERDGNLTKVPVDPGTDAYASVTDPDTWTDIDTAYQHYREQDDIQGIGYVFTADDPYVGVNLDDCRDPGTGRLEDWARHIIQRFDSYTEVSPSGTGVHVIVTGEKPDGKYRSGGVGLYDRGRYFTATGAHLHPKPATIEERSEALAAVHDAYLAESDDSPKPGDPPAASDEDAALTDAEIIERASNAENGDKFLRLWMGDTSGYHNHSEADQAHCNILAFWTGGDKHRIEWLFNQSGLTREKWNTQPDYRERTIERAIENCTDYYEP